MRILVLTNHFPGIADLQRGVFNLQQVHALRRRCEVRVAAPMQWFPVRLWHGAEPGKSPAFEEVEGIPTWHPRYFLSPRVGRDSHALQMGACLWPALNRIRREYPFDVLLATWAFPDVVVGAVAAKRWGIPLLAKVHGSDINVQSNYPLRRKQIVWALGQAHRTLAVSDALRRRMLEIGVADEKIMVHHNGVDRDRFRPGDMTDARQRLGIPTGGRHLVYVGWFNPVKAVPVLLKAFASATKGRDDVRLHLVGCGPGEAELRGLAVELGVGERVHFQGERPHDEIPTWMQAADLLCLPSQREGCPNVLLESMSTGTPVVATRVGGIPELVDARSGRLVPPDDVPAMAAALQEALKHPWDRAAIRADTERFSWQRGADALYEAAVEAVSQRSQQVAVARAPAAT